MTFDDFKVNLLHDEISFRHFHVLHRCIICFGRYCEYLLAHDVLGINEFIENLDLILFGFELFLKL
jgi:hypothetical protein